MPRDRLDFTIGLERCMAERPAMLEGARFGLLMNRASVDRHLRFACDVLDVAYPGQLTALFSPQHGLWGEQQANMIETPHGRHPRLGVPIYSLYSETRRPTPEMLAELDCFVVDLQDVGCRVYTFVWTVMNCLAACAAAGIPALILDRPNPLGNAVEGPLLEPEYRSFVGGASIPMRHGLTLGQLATLLNGVAEAASFRSGDATTEAGSFGYVAERKATLEVIPVAGCPSEATFDRFGRHWIPPSPNLPRFESALVYPGQVLLEGTNLSEGRGTTTPFELCGAPFIDEYELCELLGQFDLPGVRFLAVRFTPTFDKWAGQSCGGVSLHVTDAGAFQPYRTSVSLLAAVFQRWPDHAGWNPPPYEYEAVRMPIDILSGSSNLRTLLSRGSRITASDLDHLCRVDGFEWNCRLQPVLR